MTEEPDGVTVQFGHAAPRRFDLVVGADGLHSNVRSLVFGDSTSHENYLGYYAAAFSVADYPHRDEGSYVSYTVPGRQIARYAMRDGRSAFFVIFAQDEPLEIGYNDSMAQRAVLHDRLAGAGWECNEILAAMDDADDFYFDTASQIRMSQWWRGRSVLLGDGAYCPSLWFRNLATGVMNIPYVGDAIVARAFTDSIALPAGPDAR